MKTNQRKTASSTRTAAQRKACALCENNAADRTRQTDDPDLSPRQLAQREQIQRMVNPAQRVPVNDDPSLEREADVMGDKAVQIGSQSRSQAPHQLVEASADHAKSSAHPERSDGLPAALSAGIKSLTGMDMSHVRVHRNSSKPAQLNAHAYAQGSDIHVAPGQDKHIPHEAWHAVQQAQGRVHATTQMKRAVQASETSLRNDYAAAMTALQQAAPPQSSLVKPAQLVLTGAYAAAGLVLIAYARDSYEGTWQARLQDAQDQGFKAPNLVGHMSSSGGKDGKGEKDRQAQNNRRLADWWKAFQEWKRKRGGKKDDDDEDGASGATTTYSGQRSESHREERKEERAREKREQYEESQKEKPYVPPWNGGPSAWTSRGKT